MRRSTSLLFLAAVLWTASCSRKPAPQPQASNAPAANNPQATVLLRDGSQFAGEVTKSSTAEITLRAPNGERRTYPMGQVDSVRYATSPAPVAEAPAAAPPPAAVPAPAVTAPAPPVTAPPVEPPVQAAAPRPAPPAPVVRTIPSGTRLSVRNNSIIDSSNTNPGQRYSGVITEPVVDRAGRVAIPSGSDATLIVRSAREQGRVQGRSELALDLESVRVGGHRYRLETEDIVEKGREGVGANARTGKFAGGGAVLGTLLGAVAGGGRGAAIGALSGAAAGTATQAVTRGHGVRIPAETVMTFRLEAPVHITETR